MALKFEQKNIVNDGIIKDISESVHGLLFGTVTLTVHNGRIVQAEVAQKFRYDDVWKLEDGAGI